MLIKDIDKMTNEERWINLRVGDLVSIEDKDKSGIITQVNQEGDSTYWQIKIEDSPFWYHELEIDWEKTDELNKVSDIIDTAESVHILAEKYGLVKSKPTNNKIADIMNDLKEMGSFKGFGVVDKENTANDKFDTCALCHFHPICAVSKHLSGAISVSKRLGEGAFETKCLFYREKV